MNTKVGAQTYTYLFELTFRGTIAVSALIATFVINPSDIGQATLAGSIGFIISGLTNANWANRLQSNSVHHLDLNAGAREFISLCAVTLIGFLLIYGALENFLSDGLFWLTLASISIYLFVNLNELLWGFAGKIQEIQAVALVRFFAAVFGSTLGFVFFLTNPNKFSYLLPHFLIWFFVTLASLAVLVRHLKNYEAKILRSGNFGPSISTIKLIFYNVIISLSLVIDNLIIGFVQNTTQLAVYSMAFGVCSLFVSIMGSSFQRLYSVRQENYEISPLKSTYLLLGIFLVIFFGFLSFLTLDYSNIILRDTPKIVLLLFPSVFFRIRIAKYSAVLSRFGSIRSNFANTFLTISLLTILGLPLAHHFGAFGMAIATSITYFIMMKFLGTRIQHIQTFLS